MYYYINGIISISILGALPPGPRMIKCWVIKCWVSDGDDNLYKLFYTPSISSPGGEGAEPPKLKPVIK